MVDNAVWGYLGSALAIAFFGSNYTVMKKFETGDGFAASWLMSVGIILVGFVALSISQTQTFVATGLIGGSLWATGNLMVPWIVDTVGLGIAFLMWSGGNLLMGWAVGKFGLFGVDQEPINHVAMNIVGVVCGIISLSFYFFIKPTVEQNYAIDDEETKNLVDHSETNEQHENNNTDQHSDENTSINYEYESSTTEKQTIHNERWEKFMEFWNVAKRFVAILMSLSAGLLYGVNLVPFQVWNQDQQNKGKNPGPIDFAFSQFCGIFLLSTVAFVLYSLVKKNKPFIYGKMILPSILSGAMWAIASCGWFYSTAYLGFTVGYPIVAIGPCIVTAFWSVLVFKEIRGWKNLLLLGGSFSFIFAAIILLVLSHQ